MRKGSSPGATPRRRSFFPRWRAIWTRASAGSANRPAPRVAVEDLGSRIAGLVRNALAGEPTRDAAISGKPRRRWAHAGGAHPATHAAAGNAWARWRWWTTSPTNSHADAQQEQLERARFWRELAAGVSHEIRNPLVAIKTFTQLLPQRYTDENFRLEFREMVTREVGRLDGIVAQIEGFAHPTVGCHRPVDLPALLQEAADGARAATEAVDAQIKIIADEDLPAWRGDAKALVAGVSASVRQQHRGGEQPEKCGRRSRSALVPRTGSGSEVTGFRLAIADNGPGIAPERGQRCSRRFAARRRRASVWDCPSRNGSCSTTAAGSTLDSG